MYLHQTLLLPSTSLYCNSVGHNMCRYDICQTATPTIDIISWDTFQILKNTKIVPKYPNVAPVQSIGRGQCQTLLSMSTLDLFHGALSKKRQPWHLIGPFMMYLFTFDCCSFHFREFYFCRMGFLETSCCWYRKSKLVISQKGSFSFKRRVIIIIFLHKEIVRKFWTPRNPVGPVAGYQVVGIIEILKLFTRRGFGTWIKKD